MCFIQPRLIITHSIRIWWRPFEHDEERALLDLEKRLISFVAPTPASPSAYGFSLEIIEISNFSDLFFENTINKAFPVLSNTLENLPKKDNESTTDTYRNRH
jgi:hypothetical protein